MNNSIITIPVLNLAFAFVPVCIVLGIFVSWSIRTGPVIIAVFRMLLQLLLVGYVLTYLFAVDNPVIIVLVLAVMLSAASLISIRSISTRKPGSLSRFFIAIFTGGISSLFFITGIVLDLDPWYLPNYLVPLAGMAIANCMNTASLAAERFESEMANSITYTIARNKAFNTSLIPTINTLLAVGIVSLPGMMTGQILSGVDPLIAVRYQIVVMCMVFGCSGITSAVYLFLSAHDGNGKISSRIEES